MPATRSRLGVIFVTVVIDLIGFGIILPILPVYAQRFGAQGIGFVLGPMIGGLADHYFGHLAPGLIAAGLSLINFISAGVILRESLAEQHRTARPLFDFGHMAEALKRPQLRPLMLVWLIAPFAFAGYTVALPLHATKALGWGAKELGWLFVVIGVIAAAVQGFLFGRLERPIGARRLLVVGLFGMGVSIAVVPFVTSSLWIYGWTVPLAFANSLFAPAASGLVSVYADPTEQGTILGAAQAFAALGRSLGPLGAGWAYDGLGARSAFVLAGAVMLVGGLVSLELEATSPYAREHAPRSEEHTSELQSRFDLVCRLLLEKKNSKLHTMFTLKKKKKSINI